MEEEIKETLSRLDELKRQLLVMTDKDAECFEPLARAYGLPKGTEEEKAKKERVLEKALYEASVVPLELMETLLKVMECLKLLGEKGSRLAVSDVGVGILFAQAALEGASLNVFINTKLMKNYERAQELNQKAEALIQEGTKFQEGIYQEVCAKIR
ncbi:methenyltetrahydrofolate cyclohydrolase [Lachnospiraceae bacterium]|nr:methenyltetrahydrofolate cyclohydrolase [Lachnospiraceae bacterium]